MDTKKMSDTYLIGILLALVGGYLDAYTYIARGGVFANAQTGNIVLLGLNLSKADFKGAIYYFIPIAAFVLGIVVSELIRLRFKAQRYVHWRQITLFIEVAALLASAFIYNDMVVNVLVSFVCSVQVQAFRKVNGNVLATTMCTGNLRSAAESLFYGIRDKKQSLIKKSMQYYGIIGFFIVGAAVGSFITALDDKLSVLWPCGVLLICLVMLCTDRDF